MLNLIFESAEGNLILAPLIGIAVCITVFLILKLLLLLIETDYFGSSFVDGFFDTIKSIKIKYRNGKLKRYVKKVKGTESGCFIKSLCDPKICHKLITKVLLPIAQESLTKLYSLYAGIKEYHKELNPILYPHAAKNVDEEKYTKIIDIVIRCEHKAYSLKNRTLSDLEKAALSSNMKALILAVDALRNEAEGLENSSPAIHQMGLKALPGKATQIREDLLAAEKGITNILDGNAERAIKPAAKQLDCGTVNVKTETVVEAVRAAAKKCKSKKVQETFHSLSQLLSNYQAKSGGTNNATDNRINTQYLPTLETVLKSLSDAEQRRSKRTDELEALCLRAIQNIREILLDHESDADAALVQDMKVEVVAMERLAKSRGDLPDENNIEKILETTQR